MSESHPLPQDPAERAFELVVLIQLSLSGEAEYTYEELRIWK